MRLKPLLSAALTPLAASFLIASAAHAQMLKLADPYDLNADGSQVFTFPYVTIENVLILNSRTLLVVNDNNFPYGGGRELASDNTEFLRIRLPVSLVAEERGRRDEDDHEDD